MSQKLVLSPSVQKFVNVVEVGSVNTADQYGRRLHNFGEFLREKYNITIEEYLQSCKSYDVYDVLFEYHVYLRGLGLQKPTIASRLRTAKTFLEYNDITIVQSKFRIRVRAPKNSASEEIEALEKLDVNKIILGCQTPRLRTYVQTLAATGMRAVEALSILTKHINWEEGTVYLREEWTKQKRARTVFLTKECLEQMRIWKEYRERERRVVDKNGRVQYVTKRLGPNDLFFSSGRRKDAGQDPNYLYDILAAEFSKVLDRIGFNDRDTKSGRHEITLHSFRRFVYSTIENLGMIEFANYFIGHANSTYWRRTQEEKREAFAKVEPFLTYIDYYSLEAKGVDTDTQLQQKEERIQNLEKQVAEMRQSLQEIANIWGDIIKDRRQNFNESVRANLRGEPTCKDRGSPIRPMHNNKGGSAEGATERTKSYR
jgi:integrase